MIFIALVLIVIELPQNILQLWKNYDLYRFLYEYVTSYNEMIIDQRMIW